MKIGVLAQYLDTRNDIFEILNILRVEHEIVIYVRQTDLGKIRITIPSSITIVPICTFSTLSKLYLLLWQYIYLVFGRIPASSYNYYMTENVKLQNPHMRKLQKIAQSTLVWLSKKSPHLISYDYYLSRLAFIKSPPRIHSDIDVFLCFTEIYHDWMFAQILEQKKPVWTYVYSWDHPCKMKTFSKKTKYLVWNAGIEKDLIELQNINPEQIYVWGASQFAEVHRFLNRKNHYPEVNSFAFPYIYLGCATGYDTLAEQEIDTCIQMALQLETVLPTWKLIVRPYPFLKNQALYQKLSGSRNVVIDQNTYCEKQEITNDKFFKILHSKAFFHFGTTMGYEAGYFKTPSFLIDLNDRKSALHNFVHQYQNDKYLNGDGNNVIKSYSELISVLSAISESHPDKVFSNHKLQQTMTLQSFEQLARQLIHFMQDEDHKELQS